MKKITFILIILISLNPIFAQQNSNLCSTFPNNIQNLYNEGNYIEITKTAPKLLKTCKFSKDDKQIIYKYLIPSLNALGFDSLARQYTLKLLKINPFYKFNPSADPLPLQNFLMQFVTYPRFTFGYTLGANSLLVERQKIYTILDSMNYSFPYLSSPMFLTNAFLTLNISPHLGFGFASGISYSNFRRFLTAYNFLDIIFTEKIFAVNANIYSIYSFTSLRKYHKLTPYIKLGFYTSINQHITQDISIKIKNDSLYPNISIPSNKLEKSIELPLDHRTKYRFGLLSAFGININFQKMNLFIEADYNHDLVLYNNPNERYDELSPYYFYVDDDIILNQLSLFLGLSINFHYIVRKKF